MGQRIRRINIHFSGEEVEMGGTQKPQHTSENILATTVILTVIQGRSVGSCIQHLNQRTKKDDMRKNIMSIDLSNRVESSSNVNEKIICTSV